MKRTNAEFNEFMRKRTFDFALETLLLLEKERHGFPQVISYQLSKSATSIGANFRAFCRARSIKESYAKICIVVEEADETEYWIDLLIEGNFIKKEFITNLKNECLEILKVMSAIKHSIHP